MKFIPIILNEGRKETLKKKYADKLDPEVLDFVLNSHQLIAFNHKYTDFVLKDLVSNNNGAGLDVSWWLEEEYLPTIIMFDKYQSQLEKKDINQYKNYNELALSVDSFKEKEQKKDKESQVDRIYEDDKFLVVKPLTFESSCKYGSGTKWCTTMDSGSHFQRYTSGNQALYYVINKANSTNQYYSKIAIHFKDKNSVNYWDSKDSLMSSEQKNLFDYAFPEIVSKIFDDYEKNSLTQLQRKLNSIFSDYKTLQETNPKYLGSDSTLEFSFEGFELIPDLGFGHAEGKLAISINDKVVDAYTVFITFKDKTQNHFSISVGFSGIDPENEEDFFDTGLEKWGINSTFLLDDSSTEKMAQKVRQYILSHIIIRVKQNLELSKKFNKNTFVPMYGYTFKNNRGLVKKLVDWLDKDNRGTKLDFLSHIGNLKKKINQGKPFYSRPNEDEWKPQNFWRGQMASFFSAARSAGILDYKKVGKEFFLIKGPNFDLFKEGKLRAL